MVAITGPGADVDARPEPDLRGVAARLFPDPPGADRFPHARAGAGADQQFVDTHARRAAVVESGTDVALRAGLDAAVHVRLPALDDPRARHLDLAVVRGLGDRDTGPRAERLD